MVMAKALFSHEESPGLPDIQRDKGAIMRFKNRQKYAKNHRQKVACQMVFKNKIWAFWHGK